MMTRPPDSWAIHTDVIWRACEIIGTREKMPTWWAAECAKKVTHKIHRHAALCGCDPLDGIRITTSPLVLRSCVRRALDETGMDDPHDIGVWATEITANIGRFAVTCTCLDRKPTWTN